MWVLTAAFVVCSILDLVAEALGLDGAAFFLRLLAMPLLIGVLLAARPALSRTVVLVLGALVLSWLGDTAGGASNLAKIVLFLVAQFFFIAAFWPHRRHSLLRRRWAVLVYVALAGVIAVALISKAGDLAVPIAIYGLSLVTMAILATGISRRAGVGGLLFVISDSLLGLSWFYHPVSDNILDFLIMLTYLTAQGLLVWGVIRADQRRRSLG
ncbi:lysoplasmalogenase family protein [Microlunatus soli]|uniref:Uncharacterized membrane protein YhhN n=1 Tax=Microlunatus soli TaxID=630515 RepID=A0A1H1YGC4_9ACTN|nr:lysoplasmalogenase family protein [Microlunatus soli]SDT20444.1 Uncharacterized membrane protein YhhN [Microlunatus soli]